MKEPKFDPINLSFDVTTEYPWYDLNKDGLVFQCVRCKKMLDVGECSNCGHTEYEAGTSSSGQIGIFCRKCKKGRVRWTCPECQTDNAVETTFGKAWVSRCFVATATFDSPSAPEVIAFRRFRDNFLAHSILGCTFVRVYYSISPWLARLIASSHFLKLSSRRILVRILKMLERRGLV